MRQVFFKTVDALEAAGGDNASRFSDLNATAGKLGFWDYYAQNNGDWFTNALFNTTIDTDTSDADDTTVGASTLGLALPLKRAFQVVQGYGSQNPIATPIIGADKLVKVTASGHVATTQYDVTYTPDTTDEGDGDEIELKIVVRQTTSDYLNYLHDETAFADLSGGGFHFPLSGFHNNNHKIINISFTAGATAAATCNNLRTVIADNGVLNAMIKTNNTDDTTVEMTARHPGVVFEVIGFNLTDNKALTAGDFDVTDFIPGVGNAWQARADELKQRAISSGVHNRMYFPLSHTNFVTSASTDYDRYEITYRIDGDRDVVKGSQFGTAVIYEVDGQNDIGAVLNAGTADPTTAKAEYNF